MTEIEGLRERVAKATGPDRELDDAIWQALLWADGWREIARGQLQFTASIDAALTLVSRKLPGWFGSIPYNRNTDTWLRRDNDTPLIYGRGATPPLAILSALLAALSQEEPGRR